MRLLKLHRMYSEYYNYVAEMLVRMCVYKLCI